MRWPGSCCGGGVGGGGANQHGHRRQGLTDDRLELALSNVPPQSIVLLEDIDAAFVQRKAGESTSRGVSFSGLLNALVRAADFSHKNMSVSVLTRH